MFQVPGPGFLLIAPPFWGPPLLGAPLLGTPLLGTPLGGPLNKNPGRGAYFFPTDLSPPPDGEPAGGICSPPMRLSNKASPGRGAQLNFFSDMFQVPGPDFLLIAPASGNPPSGAPPSGDPPSFGPPPLVGDDGSGDDGCQPPPGREKKWEGAVCSRFLKVV